MPFSPDSTIFLLNVPLTANNQNQIDFADKAAQSAYFQSRIVRSFNNYTYQRKDGYIRVGVEADLLWRCNYVMYQNANFTDKWFYAFITRVEYVNPSCTFLHIKTDVFQTWQFDIKYFDSYVIREHVEDDTAGAHTLPENLETGDPVSCETVSLTGSLKSNSAAEFDENFMIVAVMSEPFAHLLYTQLNSLMGGVPDYAFYYGIPREYLKLFQQKVDEQGQAGAIVATYAVPKHYISLVPIPNALGSDKPIYYVGDLPSTAILDEHFVPMGDGVTNFNGFTPQNKKLLTYPYQYLTLRNNNGSTVDLKIENFYNEGETVFPNSAHFQVWCSPSINGAISAAPKNYLQKGSQVDKMAFQFNVEYNGFPQIAYSSDTYANYLALNANSLEFQKTSFAIRGVQTIATAVGAVMQPTGEAISGSINSTLDYAMSAEAYRADQADRQLQPRAIHGTPSGNIEIKSGSAGIFVSSMCIKNEYAQIIDEFFTKFGYQVNKTKIPQFKSRKNHNYIKTRDINLTADAPQDDIDELKTIFNNGVTFWHDPNTFGNYAYDNGVIT